jgi:alpha-glucosidase (family GH31 glycosyl hydrolase)
MCSFIIDYFEARQLDHQQLSYLPMVNNLFISIILVGIVALACAVEGAYPGYRVSSLQSSAKGYTGKLDLISAGPYGSDIKTLNLDVTYYTSSLFRVKITDAGAARWEVPWVVSIDPPASPPTNLDYTLAFPAVGSPFGFQVSRTSNKEVIFNSNQPSDQSFNGLIYDNLYLELSTVLPPNANIYGIGERITSFRLNPGTTYTLFAKDHGTPLVENLYGSHPFYLEHRSSGSAHGVFLLNSNAMDVIVGPNKLTYKTVGGILDFWFFLGPTPNAVIQQYQQVIGNPYLPAYWHLGWHQCRWGYGSVDNTANVVAQYAKNNIPLDTIWNDIDHMDSYRDFTLSGSFSPPKMQQFLGQLHANGQHYVMIIDPGISTMNGYAPYDSGIQQDIFIKTSDNSRPIVGKVWPGSTTFPDFLNLKTHDWWFQQISQFHQNGMPFDGMWIDMNEPSNFCDGQCDSPSVPRVKSGWDIDNPPYVPGGVRLDGSTLNVTALQKVGTATVPMYNTHNLFGFSEGIATKNALEKLLNKRALVISRSTFAGTGSHNGHWLGDNYSHWDNLYYSITGILSMNLFGIPLVGADICGFNEDTTEELCSRWMQLGTLYPFSRNHNTIGARSQEPYAFGTMLLNASITSLNLRYSLLPYYYTQFYHMHTSGGVFWRPLFFEFPTDTATYGLDKQFLVGPALLVSPVLEQSATTVQSYFPAAYWYNYRTGAQVGDPAAAKTITLNAPILEPINIHIRGGYVVPTQRGALTTTASRLTPFTIYAALDGKGQATGQLFLDDGEGLTTISDKKYTLINFSVTGGIFTSSIANDGYTGASALMIERLAVYGVMNAVTSVKVNGVSTAFVYDAPVKKLTVTFNSLSVGKPLSVQWT